MEACTTKQQRRNQENTGDKDRRRQEGKERRLESRRCRLRVRATKIRRSARGAAWPQTGLAIASEAAGRQKAAAGENACSTKAAKCRAGSKTRRDESRRGRLRVRSTIFMSLRGLQAQRRQTTKNDG